MEQLSPTAAPDRRRAKFVIGAGVVAVTIVVLIAWAMARPGSTAFYMTPTELASEPLSATEDYRVNGEVIEGTVQKDGLTTAFAITDGKTNIDVVTDAPLPDAFYSKDEVEVVALGRYDGSTFDAREVLAKCPSKFKAKE
jgi:cytochrome c-type biogenesis protein CcmE